LTGSTLLNPVASPGQTTQYTLVGVSNNKCPNDTGYVLVKVNPTPDIKRVAAFPSQQLIAGQPVRLEVEATNTTLYNWTPAYKLQNANTRTAIWREPDTTTTFTVFAKNEFGCIDSASIELGVDCDNTTIRIPNSFTPNGDGLNDTFRPLARFKNNPHVESFQVFNRWGQLVYKKENVHVSDIPGWDGTVNGVPQPAATYVWQVAVRCGSGIVYRKDVVIMIR
jgi:gliding motility-associated-like protein